MKKPQNIPHSPGVYVFRSRGGVVLYVGRAVSLKRRLANYFQKNLEPKTREMTALAQKIEWQTTETILEAVILEANLIKEHWPKYNIKDRDNRSFIYIVIAKSDYPYPMIVRGRELKRFPQARKGHNVFGPYQSVSLVRNALKIIRRVFPYSSCRPNRGQPCFYYQIGLCPGVCVKEVSVKDYQENIKNIVLLLSGQKKRLLKKLQIDNPEQAGALKHIQDVSLITGEPLSGRLNRIEAYDISHLTGREVYGAMAVFINGRSEKRHYRLFKIRTSANDDLRSLEEVLKRRFKHREWPYPDLILLDGGRPQISYLNPILKKMNIGIPVIGISKFKNDELVFAKDTKQSIKKLGQDIKKTLVAARDEAHRFGLKTSQRKRKTRLK